MLVKIQEKWLNNAVKLLPPGNYLDPTGTGLAPPGAGLAPPGKNPGDTHDLIM